jgi:hypothetical protein
VLAKSLVRNRQYVTKMHRTKANLQAVSLKITVRLQHRATPLLHACTKFTCHLRLQTLKSTEAMAKAMAGATKVRPALRLLLRCRNHHEPSAAS